MKKYDDALDEVESRLALLAESIDPAKAIERAFFMKVTMPLLGLTVPQQRKTLQKGYSFSSLDFEEQVPIWSYIWDRARTHEAKVQAVFFVEKPDPFPDAEWLWHLLSSWADSINCWDQSDCLSRIYCRLHELIPQTVYPELVQWNSNEFSWKRRQSLVSLLFYSRMLRHLPPSTDVFLLVEKLLRDDDYYVQKGVGWTLREAHNCWPLETEEFLVSHARQLAPAAWQAATEKLTGAFKADLKKLRGRPKKLR